MIAKLLSLKLSTILLLLAVALLTAAWGWSESGKDKLSRVLKDAQLGMSEDQWLEQYAAYRKQWDKTALVFGTGDDYEFCTKLAEGLVLAYPKAKYRCVPAN